MENRPGFVILCDESELLRLHGVAYSAAVQTGAKGIELDTVTASIFSALIAQNNRAFLDNLARPQLKLVEI